LLGLINPPQKPARTVEFRALPNLCVFAGTDVSSEKLITLFHYTRIKRIDRIFEFQLDKKAMSEMPSRTSAGKELKKTLQDLLGNRAETGGTLHITSCSALVIPEDPAMIEVIRKHAKLKGYIKRGGPPGYLLVKSESDIFNFVKRCREFGFDIKES
jgi:hypothetical protein